VLKAEKLTTILCRCHEIWEPSPSWRLLGHSRPVTGLLYLYLHWGTFHSLAAENPRSEAGNVARACKLYFEEGEEEWQLVD